MTLQEQSYDMYTEHAVEVNKYAQSEKATILSEIAFVLNEIKQALLNGPVEVNRSEIRAMISEANRLFKEGMKLIRINIESDSDDFLALELEKQVESLQDLFDDFSIEYSIRQPGFNKTKLSIKENPINGQTFIQWFDQWETKTKNLMDTALLRAQGVNEDGNPFTRDEIVYSVFGRGNNPLQEPTFARQGSDIGGLLVSLTDSIMTETTNEIGASNPGIIIGEEWNSCLCATTCARCASLHGAVRYFSGEDQTDGNEIPLHPNCQCHWTPVYRQGNQMSATIPKEQRNNINSDTNAPRFQVWYNSINRKRKLDLFGPTRVKMLDNGSIKINQLLSSKNRRIYSLEELKNKGYRISKKD